MLLFGGQNAECSVSLSLSFTFCMSLSYMITVVEALIYVTQSWTAKYSLVLLNLLA